MFVAPGTCDRRDLPPRHERQSHYFEADLPKQFDVVLHYDRTRAVEPLPACVTAAGEPPETWPSGI
jgi:hypothetical protein